MTKKPLLILIGIALMILLPMAAAAQETAPFPPANNGPTITEKQSGSSANYNFPLTYPGVTMFMEDLEIYEPQNYELLLPAYGKIEEKNRRKRNTIIAGCTISGIAVASGITAAVLAETAFAIPDEDFGTRSNHNLSFSGTGAIALGLLGFSVTFIINNGPQEEDYMRLINTYNRNNPETPIEIERSIEIH